ncbi:MAG: DnaJ C-terminal domain-containing protein [Bacteroidota bacterium]
MIYKDYYKDLGVRKTAAPGEIKKAYRRLAKKYHPEKSKGNKTAITQFKNINEANTVLGDPAKRKKYDQLVADWKRYENTGSIETETTISLEDAYHGVTRLIRFNGQAIKVRIKPGVADLQILKIAGKGGRGRGGGRNGDFSVTVRVAPHLEFRRIGNDLRRDLPVKSRTAILGGKTQITTLKGKVKINIPKGTSTGKMLKLRGHGMPIYAKKNRFGDLLVKVSIMKPDHLMEEQIDLFGTLAP